MSGPAGPFAKTPPAANNNPAIAAIDAHFHGLVFTCFPLGLTCLLSESASARTLQGGMYLPETFCARALTNGILGICLGQRA